MKIRLKGNSIRLRLGPSEVASVLSTGVLTETTRITRGVRLTFVLQSNPSVKEVTVTADGMVIWIDVPADAIKQWGTGDEVGITADAVADGRPAVLIEKDYQSRHDGPTADVFRGSPPNRSPTASD